MREEAESLGKSDPHQFSKEINKMFGFKSILETSWNRALVFLSMNINYIWLVIYLSLEAGGDGKNNQFDPMHKKCSVLRTSFVSLLTFRAISFLWSSCE